MMKFNIFAKQSLFLILAVSILTIATGFIINIGTIETTSTLDYITNKAREEINKNYCKRGIGTVLDQARYEKK